MHFRSSTMHFNITMQFRLSTMHFVTSMQINYKNKCMNLEHIQMNYNARQ